MREILFRGKRMDNGEWVDGNLYESNFGGSYILVSKVKIRKKDGVAIGDSFDVCKVDPSTVGQYTGLTDKNGKRIFEGDRVVYPDSTVYSSYDDYNEGVVGYDEEAMRFYFTDRWSVEMEDFDVVNGMMVDVAVIGNIHDNPELRKEIANGTE